MNNKKIKNYRWLILTLLVTATTINYLDRQIIGLLKPILEVEFDWTEIEYGYIIMVFTGAYAIGLISWGGLTDRIGTKLSYKISVIAWSTMGILHALARSVMGFALARIGLGLTEGGNTPAGMKVIAEWFPEKERGLAAGLFNAGTSLGTILAILLVPLILIAFSWHWVFIITGSLGFIWLIFWIKIYDTPDKQKRLTAKEYVLIHDGQHLDPSAIKEVIPINWLRLFTFKQTWAFIVGKILSDPIYWFFMFWLPSYFSSIFHLDMSKLSPELIIIYSATVIGSIGGGYLSSVLIKKGWAAIKARKIALLAFAILILVLLFLPFATNMWVVVGIISFILAMHQAWSANMFTLVTDFFPNQAVSSVTGIGAMAGAIGGMLFPLLIGYILDKYKAVGNLEEGYNILFIGCAFAYLVAWIIIHLLTRKSAVVKLNDLI